MRNKKVCFHNQTSYFSEAIDSILGQTFPPLEVMVVDDGSTDETGEVIKSYGKQIKSVYQ